MNGGVITMWLKTAEILVPLLNHTSLCRVCNMLAPLRLGTDCSGMETPSFALRGLKVYHHGILVWAHAQLVWAHAT